MIRLDDWEQYCILKNGFDKPKIFQAESEAIDYCKEREIHPFQVVELVI